MRNRASLLTLLVFVAVIVGIGWSLGVEESPVASNEPDSQPSESQHVSVTQELPPIFRETVPELRCRFPVINDTGTAIYLSIESRSCSCTEAELEDNYLEPKASTTLNLAIAIHSRSGPQKFVTRLGDGSGKAWDYIVKTYVCESGAFPTDIDLSFGAVNPNATLERTAYFDLHAESESILPKDLTFTSENSAVTISSGPGTITRLTPGLVRNRIPLTLRLTSASVASPNSARITARFTRHDRVQEVQGLSTWVVRSLFSINPPILFFGQVNPDGPELTREVVIRRMDGSAMSVTALDVPQPFRAEAEKGDNMCEQRIILRLRPEELTRSVNGMLVVRTDHPIQGVTNIPLAVVLHSEGRN